MIGERLRRKAIQQLAARYVPHAFLAAQLRHPNGWVGRWVMTRAFDIGNAELIRATLDALALRRDDTFLDLGFGGGLALRLAAQRSAGQLWGIDSSTDVVRAGARRLQRLIGSGRLNLLTADVADLPIRDGLIAAISTINTIYFWPDPELALRSLRRTLRPGGRLALGYSGAEKLRQFGRITRHGFHLYEPQRVEALLQAAGYDHIETLPLSGGFTRGDFVTRASSPG